MMISGAGVSGSSTVGGCRNGDGGCRPTLPVAGGRVAADNPADDAAAKRAPASALIAGGPRSRAWPPSRPRRRSVPRWRGRDPRGARLGDRFVGGRTPGRPESSRGDPRGEDGDRSPGQQRHRASSRFGRRRVEADVNGVLSGSLELPVGIPPELTSVRGGGRRRSASSRRPPRSNPATRRSRSARRRHEPDEMDTDDSANRAARMWCCRARRSRKRARRAPGARRASRSPPGTLRGLAAHRLGDNLLQPFGDGVGATGIERARIARHLGARDLADGLVLAERVHARDAAVEDGAHGVEIGALGRLPRVQHLLRAPCSERVPSATSPLA